MQEKIFKLVTDPKTVLAAMEADPTAEIGKVAEKVFPEKAKVATTTRKVRMHDEYTPEDLERAERCGKFPYKPSDLFLKMYCDVLETLEHGPLKNMVSPSLIGASGIIPITIFSLIPDIMRYYKHLIVNAQHEVMLATNYWEPSFAASFVYDGLVELSKRHEGKDTKPVVKLIIDRGSPKQLIKPHIAIPPSAWEDLGIPSADKCPNLIMQVMNYHKPPVGTFHSKYMVVDRRIAILNSNNIQDRVNLEMMIHLEGPIVESFYDMSLISWNEKLEPPLPLLANPSLAVKGGGPEAFQAAAKAKEELVANNAETQPKHPDAEADSRTKDQKPITDFTLLNAEGFNPFIVLKEHAPVPIAMVNRAPHGAPGHGDVDVAQNVAWLSGIRLAKESVFIQTPDFNAPPVVEAILEACRRGIYCTLYVDLGYNDQGEMLPMQGGTNTKVLNEMSKKLQTEGKRQFLKACWYVGKDRNKPVDASAKERNCHVKFISIDGKVGMCGNGNQDTQSWYHSQEINVMVDSAEICQQWVEALNHNQNTGALGALDDDGEWRDQEGNIVTSSGGKGGFVEVIKGMGNAVQRVRGKGGF